MLLLWILVKIKTTISTATYTSVPWVAEWVAAGLLRWASYSENGF